MRSLYEIDEDIMNCFDEDGEVLDEEKLNQLSIEREQKIEGVGCAIKNLSAEIEAYKAEIKSFNERKKSAERKLEGYKHWLSQTLDGKKFSSSKVAIGFRKSKVVNILDEEKIPEEYFRYKVDRSPDKTLIKEAITKDGLIVEGAEVVESLSMSVK